MVTKTCHVKVTEIIYLCEHKLLLPERMISCLVSVQVVNFFKLCSVMLCGGVGCIGLVVVV